jgi:hypothetical protein
LIKWLIAKGRPINEVVEVLDEVDVVEEEEAIEIEKVVDVKEVDEVEDEEDLDPNEEEKKTKLEGGYLLPSWDVSLRKSLLKSSRKFTSTPFPLRSIKLSIGSLELS